MSVQSAAPRLFSQEWGKTKDAQFIWAFHHALCVILIIYGSCIIYNSSLTHRYQAACIQFFPSAATSMLVSQPAQAADSFSQLIILITVNTWLYLAGGGFMINEPGKSLLYWKPSRVLVCVFKRLFHSYAALAYATFNCTDKLLPCVINDLRQIWR